MACAVATGFWWETRETPVDGVSLREEVPREEIGFDNPTTSSPGYLGPQACSECHAKRVAEFQATRHFQACVLPQPEAMSSEFNSGTSAYATRDPNLRFEMHRQGDEFLMTSIQQSSAGAKRTTSPIGLVYGAGANADEVYFTWHGDRLQELPIVWLNPFREWGAMLFDPHGSGDFARNVTPRCLECHNTWFEHVPGTVNQYRRENMVLGVTCEVCHGPGREHVAFHQGHPDASAAAAIVHPGRLSRERQTDLCAVCHSNAMLNRGPAFRYRPGEPLDAHFKTLQIEHPEEDHLANQTKYLVQSRCYQNSDTLTCITCHNPHRPRSATNAGAESCRKCHQAADCGEQDRLPVELRGRCVDCHMPQIHKIQVAFRTERDAYLPPAKRWEHRIGVYPVARDEVLLAWHQSQTEAQHREEAARLSRMLAEHWLAEAESQRREYRFLAAINSYRQAERFDPQSGAREKLAEVIAIQTQLDDNWSLALHQLSEQRFTDTTATLLDILKLKPTHAGAHGRLGMLHAINQQTDLATEHLQAVERHDPNDQYGESMLGWLAYLGGRWEESRQHYQHADEITPFNAKINYQLAMTLTKLNRLPEAVQQFQQTLTIDPQHVEACRGLSFVLRQQGQAKEAIAFAKRAVQLTQSNNVEALAELAETYFEAGQMSAASDTAAKGLALAKTSKPPVNPQIRRRLERLSSNVRKSAK